MNDRTYRIILGALLLLSLYLDLNYLMCSLIVILYVEGISNWRIPRLVQKIRGTSVPVDETDDELAPPHPHYRFNFEAERAWRLVVATMLLVTFVMLYDALWFFPWFMGFAILGAGISGVCPVLFTIRWAGFK